MELDTAEHGLLRLMTTVAVFATAKVQYPR
jgi:hypothetical protein